MDVRKTFAEFDAVLEDAFCVPCKSTLVPERYHGKRDDINIGKLGKKVKKTKDPRSVTVKYDRTTNKVKGTKERIETIEEYTRQAEQGQELSFNVDERLQYLQEIKFVQSMLKFGIMSEEDFE